MLRQIEQAIERVPGIRACTVNATTGSLLVRYDEDDLDVERLVRSADVLTLESSDDRDGNGRGNSSRVGARSGAELEQWSPLSETAEGINASFAGLDEWFREATGRRFDLKMLFPTALGVLAVRQFVSQLGQLPAIPWYVVAWYAFDSYLKLHGSPGQRTFETMVERAVDVAEGPRAFSPAAP